MGPGGGMFAGRVGNDKRLAVRFRDSLSGPVAYTERATHSTTGIPRSPVLRRPTLFTRSLPALRSAIATVAGMAALRLAMPPSGHAPGRGDRATNGIQCGVSIAKDLGGVAHETARR